MFPALQPFIQSPVDAETYAVLGHRYIILASGERTGGAFALIHAEIPPRDAGPPPHTHHREDEHFYILRGKLAFVIGSETREAAAGSFVVAPRGIRHTFRNAADSVARLLVLLTPAGFERFFMVVGQRLPGRESTCPPATEAEVRKILTAAPEFGLEVHL
ncbi:MAG: cupin domain-containing protein [Planctomycetes bacterium]|nr:cupin domain-containing protein [Planctomycetota bacterium]